MFRRLNQQEKINKYPDNDKKRPMPSFAGCVPAGKALMPIKHHDRVTAVKENMVKDLIRSPLSEKQSG